MSDPDIKPFAVASRSRRPSTEIDRANIPLLAVAAQLDRRSRTE